MTSLIQISSVDVLMPYCMSFKIAQVARIQGYFVLDANFWVKYIELRSLLLELGSLLSAH